MGIRSIISKWYFLRECYLLNYVAVQIIIVNCCANASLTYHMQFICVQLNRIIYYIPHMGRALYNGTNTEELYSHTRLAASHIESSNNIIVR